MIDPEVLKRQRLDVLARKIGKSRVCRRCKTIPIFEMNLSGLCRECRSRASATTRKRYERAAV